MPKREAERIATYVVRALVTGQWWFTGVENKQELT